MTADQELFNETKTNWNNNSLCLSQEKVGNEKGHKI